VAEDGLPPFLLSFDFLSGLPSIYVLADKSRFTDLDTYPPQHLPDNQLNIFIIYTAACSL
jgi:hypothetical protein